MCTLHQHPIAVDRTKFITAIALELPKTAKSVQLNRNFSSWEIIFNSPILSEIFNRARVVVLKNDEGAAVLKIKKTRKIRKGLFYEILNNIVI